MELMLLDGLFLSDSPPEKDVQWSDTVLHLQINFYKKFGILNNLIIKKKN